MSYFKKLPDMLYDLPVNGKDTTFLVKDITANIRIISDVLSNITLYDEYDIVDGETPEIISQKFYGTSKYHWVIMIANDKYDYSTDFPLTFNRLEDYVKDKYGEDNLYSIHHYEDEYGNIVNSDYPNSIPVTNLDYEGSVNETKRRIKIIDKSLIQKITNELESLFS